MRINTCIPRGLVWLLILGFSAASLVAQGRRALRPREIEELLKGGVPTPRVVALVGQLGVDFRLTASLEKELREAGADANLLEAVRKETRRRLPEEAERHLTLGEQHAASGEYANAIGEFDQATKLAPRWPEAYLGRAKAYHALQNYTMALEDLRRALGLTPRPADQKQIKKNITQLEATWKKQRSERLVRHLAVAPKLEQEGNWVGLEKEAQAALEIDSHNADAHAWLAVALARNGRHAPRPSNSPKKPYAWVLTRPWRIGHEDGLILTQTGENGEEALEEFQRAVDLDLRSSRGFAYLAMALRQKTDLEGAVRATRKAVELDPDHTQIRLLLANLLHEKRDWDGALAEYRSLTERDPGNPAHHVCICEALRQKGEVDGALAACTQALKLNPNSAVALHLRGLLLEKKGDLEGAESSLRQAASLDPNDQALRQNLERLEKLNYRPSLKR